jgi:glutamine amidotransferase
LIAVVDYGLGNIQNVLSALTQLGLNFLIDTDGTKILGSDICLVPGVANFGAGIAGMKARGQFEVIKDFAGQDKRVVGLCLGAQMLFNSSQESPGSEGLGLISGSVVRLTGAHSRVPNQGWSRLITLEIENSLGHSLQNYFYFSHSFEMQPIAPELVIATTGADAGEVNAVVRKGNILAIQFHPERSGVFGLKLLERVLKEGGSFE